MKGLSNKNPASGDGQHTPLHFASDRGHFEVCKLILENISEKNPRNNNGDTPLHIAASNGHLEICTFMIANGAEKYALNIRRKTPKDLAIRGKHVKVIELFK